MNNESTQAGNYELMDIVAMKVIERSKIPTYVIKSDPKVIRKPHHEKQTNWDKDYCPELSNVYFLM